MPRRRFDALVLPALGNEACIRTLALGGPMAAFDGLRGRAAAGPSSESERDAEEATTKDCPFCLTAVPLAATRCPACTSALEK